MQPQAYLLLSNLPAENKLKTLKYYLARGDNILGKEPRCQLLLPEKYCNLDHICNIHVGYNFITLQPFQDHYIYVDSNRVLQANSNRNQVDNYFSLDSKVKYLPKTGEYFYIGRVKAIIICNLNTADLLLIKNVVNEQIFKPRENVDLKDENVNLKSNEECLKLDEKVEQKEEQMEIGFTLIDNELKFSENQMDVEIPVNEEAGREEAGNEEVQQKGASKKQIVDEEQQPIHNTQPIGENDQNHSNGTEVLPEEQEEAFDPTIVINQFNTFNYQPTLNLEDQWPPHLNPPIHSSIQQPLSIPVKPNLQIQQNLVQQSVESPSNQKYQHCFQRDESKGQKRQPILIPSEIVNQLTFSQESLLNEIRKKERRGKNVQNEQESGEFSMPDTIMEGHVQPNSEESNKQQKPQQAGDEMEMPPTVQEEDIFSNNKTSQQHSIKIKHTKTLVNPPHITIDHKMFRSQTHPNKLRFTQDQENKSIEDFLDLFGVVSSEVVDKNVPSDEIQVSEQEREQKTPELKPLDERQKNDTPELKPLERQKVSDEEDDKQSNQKGENSQEEYKPTMRRLRKSSQKQTKENPVPSMSLMNISSINSTINRDLYLGFKRNPTNQIEKEESNKPAKKNKPKNIKQPETNWIMVSCVGFKPTKTHKEYLEKEGYKIISGAHDDYEILIIKEPIKITNKLLVALINEKKIEGEPWVFNKRYEIKEKVHGFDWKHIYSKRGTQKLLFKGQGRFYISKKLSELLDNVIEACGGDLIEKLEDKRRALNLILKIQESHDTELYLEHKDAKKWKFLRPDFIIDSILIGEYLPADEKYVIHIF